MVKLGFKTQQSGPEAPAPFNVSVKDPPIVRASSFISTLNSTEVQGRTPDWNRDSQGILRRAGEPAAAAAGSLGKRKDGGAASAAQHRPLHFCLGREPDSSYPSPLPPIIARGPWGLSSGHRKIHPSL